jgi:N-acetylglucosamine repressor
MTNNAATVSDSNSLKKGLLFSMVRKKGPISKKDIGLEFKASLTTISRLLNELIADGLVREENYGKSEGGRRPTLFAVDGSHCVSYGISISRDRLEMILLNLNGTVLTKREYWYDNDTNAQRIIDEVCSFLREPLENDYTVLGAGISTFGPLDRRHGIILSPRHARIRGWKNIPICQLIRRNTGVDVMLENHARAIALAEQWFGGGKGYASVAHIHVDYGIGASTSNGPDTRDKENDLTGAIGTMIVDLNAALDHNDEDAGTLEDYTSIEAMIEQTARRTGAGKASDFDFRTIVDAYRRNDTAVREIVNRAALIFGMGLANYVSLVCPDVVILGGATIDKLPDFFDIAVETTIQHLDRRNIRRPLFQKTSLAHLASCIGAATQVFEEKFHE